MLPVVTVCDFPASAKCYAWAQAGAGHRLSFDDLLMQDDLIKHIVEEADDIYV